ncbi:MAG: aryl-sulfate sulfotransferase [Chitinophagales bacterium]|nr:aryl-sulfate sulfotransferase [Chitinophagales bacterium]
MTFPIKLACYFILVFNVSYSYAQFQFIAPVPGSSSHNPDRCIIIREGHEIDKSVLEKKSFFKIEGSKSGNHDFSINLSNDRRTIILKPVIPFSYSEKVTVQIKGGLYRNDGAAIMPLSFSFSIHRKYTDAEQKIFEDAVKKMDAEGFAPEESGSRTALTGNVNVLINLNPHPGDIFYDFASSTGIGPTGGNIITSNDDSIFSLVTTGVVTDFKINHNGYLTYTDRTDSDFKMLDSSYHFIKSFKPANGYKFDNHEFQIFPDGHYYMIALDDSIIDLTQFNPYYQSNAVVIGSVIQEFDDSDNLIFEWRSFDHVDLFEAVHQNFALASIDYIHTNSIEEDSTDGNIIISNRHFDQVDKIDVNTGEFIWRLGGVENEFTFLNDTAKFNYQHDARRLANGHISMFDNGNYHFPPQSFGKEYALNFSEKTAKLVWSYAHPLINGTIPVQGRAMGSVQRFSDGGTFIDWGLISDPTNDPSFTEVDSANQIVWEGKIVPSNNVSYRAHRFIWTPCARPSDQSLLATDITSTSARLSWGNATNASSFIVQYRDSGSVEWTTVSVPDSSMFVVLTGLKSGTTYEWEIQSVCNAFNPPASDFSAIKTFTTPYGTFISNQIVQELKIFPNPAHDFIYVSLPDGSSKKATIQLLNAVGEIVFNESFPGLKGGFTIPLKNLSTGMYMVKAISDHQIFMKKALVE